MGTLHFQVLGPVRVLRDSAEIALGSPQQQALLAALLLRPGHTARADELIDALWGPAPPASAKGVLRTYAWRLRRLLSAEDEPGDAIVSSAGGYRMTLTDYALDAVLAERLDARAERARAEGRAEQARQFYRQALELWAGEPLAGLPGPFAQQQRHRFTELRLSLWEQRIDLDLALGRSASCIPELTVLCAEHPLRERLYCMLMRALAQAGRQGDAFAVFRRARRLLIEELGVEPGAELAAVHEQLLAGDIGEGAAAAVQPSAANPRPAQLPPDDPDFIGRAEHAAALCAELTRTGRAAPALLALAGMGGVGKSTLALHVAHRVRAAFPDGQLYADLRGDGGAPASPEAVLDGFLSALGVRLEEIPPDAAARSALLRSLTDGRRLLFVLDDAADEAQVRPLLPGTAGCAVLVTSRRRLISLPVTTQLWLDVFDDAEAFGLLARVVGDERVATAREQAGQLLLACGHLPLAVRIVAARLAARPAWTFRSMLERLDDTRPRLHELRAGGLAVSAPFDVGYRQLTRDQAEAFRLLGLADRAGISLDAAAALLDRTPEETEPLLESLVDVAMLESPAERGYRHHSLLREFAHRLAEQDGDAREGALLARARLLGHLLAGACAAFAAVVPGDPIRDALGPTAGGPPGFSSPARARAWVLAEYATMLDAAVQIALEAGADGPLANRYRELVPGAANLLVALSPFRNGQQSAAATAVVRELAAVAGPDDLRTRGRLGYLAGNLALATSQFDEARERSRQARELCRAAGDEVILRQVVNDLGVIAYMRGRFAEAVEHLGEAVELARRLGHRAGETASALNLAGARIHAGQAEDVLAECTRRLSEQRTPCDDAETAQTHYVTALALNELARPREAAEHFADAADVWAAAGADGRAARALLERAKALDASGEHELAGVQAIDAVTALDRSGSPADLDAARRLSARLRSSTSSHRR